MKHDEYDRFCDCKKCKRNAEIGDVFRRLRKARDDNHGVRLSLREIELILEFVSGDKPG